MSVEVSNIARCSSKTNELRDIDSIGCRERGTSPFKNRKMNISKSKSSRLSYILVETISLEIDKYNVSFCLSHDYEITKDHIFDVKPSLYYANKSVNH